MPPAVGHDRVVVDEGDHVLGAAQGAVPSAREAGEGLGQDLAAERASMRLHSGLRQAARDDRDVLLGDLI
jgi:hypothetical protein